MNIIINEKIHNELQKNIISTIEFGSKLKGESNEKSDSDLLHIVKSADWWVSLPFANQHLLQYKTETEDHIYCNAHTFVKSILDGDTTIFIEMHHFGGLKDTCLSFLEKYNLTYYRTLRAYLGVARRDMKDIKKMFKSKDTRKMNKKFKFIQNSMNYVIDNLEENGYKNEIVSILEQNELYKNKIIDVENFEYKDLTFYEKHFISLTDDLRDFVNKEVSANRLKKTITTNEALILLSELNEIEIHSNIMLDVKNDIISHFFNSYVEGF